MTAKSPGRLFVSFLLVFLLAGSGLLLLLPGPVSAAVPINRDRVKNVIYPTLGFPAIVKTGGQLTVEFDPRNQDWSQPLPQLVEFQVEVLTTNDQFPVTQVLPVEQYTLGYSATWPEYSQYREPRAKIYLVTVDVPEHLPLHLYDLTVRARLLGGTWMTDTQPHALQTVNTYKDDYRIAQLTDIHVFGPEISYPTSCSQERNYRHETYSKTDGYGAAYYHKTIEQVNLEKPEFVSFTGDYDYSQKYLRQVNYNDWSQYRNTPWNGKYYEPYFEMDWFYQETLKLDVPVFMSLGNHDGYARYDSSLINSQLEEDYQASWRNLFGPQYFSFDYGADYHFTSVNSNDWGASNRKLTSLLGIILLPDKWQGQVEAGGDKWAPGWSQAREDAINTGNFTNQLLWLKNDLESHAGAKMRTILVHHDPWREAGGGLMFDNETFMGIPLGGKGDGRLALIKLARQNNVALMLSGHQHSDGYGSIPWELGGGTLRFVNTTSTQVQGDNSLYPGYRIVHIQNGVPLTVGYKLDGTGTMPLYSWPVYAGTNVGGSTDWTTLSTPAIQTAWTPDPGSAEDVTCRITNHLPGNAMPSGDQTGDINGASLEYPMPFLSGGYYYTVTNGSWGEVYDDSETAPTHRVCQVFTDVDHAPSGSTPTLKDVRVQKSATPDVNPPTCTSFLINGGAPETDRIEVSLTNNATDADSGVLSMRIWNDGDDPDAAPWQRWEPQTDWELKNVGGMRTVHIQFRDMAMPPNVSTTYSDSIILAGNPPVVTGIVPDSANVGDTIDINGTNFGTASPSDLVRFNGVAAEVTAWSDTKITCKVPLGAYTGVVTVTNDAGSASGDFTVLPRIESIAPDFGYNNAPVHIEHLEGTGFYPDTGYPRVELSNGTDHIHGTNVQFVSPQSVTCDFDITGAAVGPYNVTVENPDGQKASLDGGFIVDYPPPQVTAVAPATGLNNGTINITDLSGAFFRDGMRVFLSNGGAEIEASNVVVVSAVKATCTFDLNGAAAGGWDVVAMNTDMETGTLPGGFTVEYPAPGVTGITPSQGFINGTVDVTDLAGSCFRAGATVKLVRAGQPDIAATDVVVASAAKITCGLDLAGAAAGRWGVVVTNDDGKSFTLPNAFEARWSNTHVDSIEPDSGKPGDVVTINGANFGAQQDASSVAFGTAVVDEVVSWSGTQIKCRVPVGGSGDLPVVVTGPGGPSNAAAFSVLQPAWYLAEGSTAWGFETYVSVENPQPDRTATVDVTYMTDSGSVPGGTFGIKPASQLTINPAAVVGGRDFSTKVVCREGFDIAVDRTMSWGGGIEGHSSIGVPGPATSWYLAEGCSAFGFETWLLVQNPGATTASCTITYMVEGEGPVPVTKTVAPGSRATFNMARDIGEKNASVKVESNVPVIPERAMYRNDRREGSDSIGATAPAMDFYLAEGSTAWGFTTWLLVQNPNDSAANVTVTYMTPEGPAVQKPVSIPAGSRLSVRANDQVPDTDMSIRVHGDKPIIAERAMYWDNGTGEASHDSIGVAGAHAQFFLPDGQTYEGRKTYTLVQNPNPVAVSIEVTYMTDASGGNVTFTDSVPANSRKTYDMSEAIASGRASTSVVCRTAGKRIMVERSMYWNDKGAGTSTIGGYSD
jgi:hypothetical protein